ncbi:MAG: hypothetical protein K0R57_4804 [Paenibacillaceae bacterium]|jgi:hypothetical protein|nr:hypothetical protein [Paenibacillaceae bacterium]
MNKSNISAAADQQAQGFTKKQFLSSKGFKPAEKDVLHVILEDNQIYTPDQVHQLVSEFSNRKVR